MRWFSEHKKAAAVISIVLVLFILTVVTFVNKGTDSWLGEKIQRVISFAQEPATEATNGLSRFFKGVFQFSKLTDENEELKGRINELEAQLMKSELSKAELAELRELSGELRFLNEADLDYISADVIGMDASSLFNIFTVNAGEKDGIKQDCTVLEGNGLVGRIMSAGNSSSKVIAIIDEDMNISFKIRRNLDAIGVVHGDGKGGMEGYMLDPEANVLEGDEIITSGMELYPEGIIIGKVTSASKDPDSMLINITAEPGVNFKKIQKVTIIK